MAAAEALGKIKDPRATEALIFAALRDDFIQVRKIAIWALGEIKDPRAVEPLMKAIADHASGIRDEASKALEKITGEKSVQVP